MKRVLLFIVLLFGLVSIGLAMYGRGPKTDQSFQSGSEPEDMHARSLPRSRMTFSF